MRTEDVYWIFELAENWCVITVFLIVSHYKYGFTMVSLLFVIFDAQTKQHISKHFLVLH